MDHPGGEPPFASQDKDNHSGDAAPVQDAVFLPGDQSRTQ